MLVEAKAGAAATIASPALDFGRHAQSVQDLVLKAYKQCERFFSYLNSADEVPIFRRVAGKYEECGRVRRKDYRVKVPIGLTVESFSPFSAFCKELPGVQPLLGQHPFVSLSIDDLFVVKRFLPTPGEFAHYLEVRQSVAGMRGAHLFDELDHLGAYITKNRFDMDIAEQAKGGASMIVWDGMSEKVDGHFGAEDWDTRPVPTQKYPDEVLRLLAALNSTRAPGWLSAESHIRNFGDEGRSNLAKMLADMRKTLNEHPGRYFIILGEQPLFVWLQRRHEEPNWAKINDKASAAALAAGSSSIVGVFAEVSASGTYDQAHRFPIHVPVLRTEQNAHVYEDAERMSQPKRAIKLGGPTAAVPKAVKAPGRNDPCPCGSGQKFKRCHGR